MPTAKRRLSTRIRETLTISGVFMVLVALIQGAAIPLFANPHLALSAHLTGLMMGTLLVVFGTCWRHVELSGFGHHLSCWLCIFGGWLVFAGNFFSAIKNTGLATPIGHAANVADVVNATQKDEWIATGILAGGSVLLVLGILLLLKGLLKNRGLAQTSARLK